MPAKRINTGAIDQGSTAAVIYCPTRHHGDMRTVLITLIGPRTDLGLSVSVSAAGCGGSSSPSDPAAGAAKRFVSAVTHDDRGTWCGQIGDGLLVAHKTGGLPPQLLSQCKTSDLFEITGDCDREGVISGSSVTGDSVHGDSADVHLSSGATLGLQQSAQEWYVTSISGGTPRHIKHGRCAGAGGG